MKILYLIHKQELLCKELLCLKILIMKYSILTLIFFVLFTSCYTNSNDESDDLLFRGTNAYYNSNNEHMTRSIFEEVANKKESASLK